MVRSRIGPARRVVAVCVTVAFVARSGCFALGLLLFFGSSSCLLYTDHINHPPTVKLTGAASTFFAAKPRPRYHAEAHDQDQSADSLTYEWRRQMGLCPMSLNEALVGVPVASKPDFEIDLDFTARFCVWVVVRDSDGATAYDKVATEITHRDTTAVIEVVKPLATPDDHYPLFSEIQLSAAKSEDPENPGAKLGFRWTLTRGNETLTSAGVCPPNPATDICFTADKEGMYMATLVVTDGKGTETTKTKMLVVEPDAAPCITVTDPEFGLESIARAASELQTFEVKAVSDDGDPFPLADSRPSSATFKGTWWLDGEDSNLPSGRRPDGVPDPQRVQFSANYFRDGDRVFVRLQVNDRVNRDFSACARDRVMNCALDPKRPRCFQWVTWKVDFRLGRDM